MSPYASPNQSYFVVLREPYTYSNGTIDVTVPVFCLVAECEWPRMTLSGSVTVKLTCYFE